MELSRHLRILGALKNENLSISELVLTVLCHSEQLEAQFKDLIDDLYANTAQILAAFAMQPKSTEISKKWAHTLACQLYLKDIDHMLRIQSGLQFNISHAQHTQISGFNMESLAKSIECGAPHLWDLTCMLLGSRRALDWSEETADEARALRIVSSGIVPVYIC